MGLALTQILIGFTALCIVPTLIAAPVMNFFVKEMPLRKLALVFFWASFRVLFIAAVVIVGIRVGQVDVPAGVDGLFTLIGMCAVGSLITYSLEHYGIPRRKFPGVGAKTIVVLLGFSWVI